jgi:hypothetical protein
VLNVDASERFKAKLKSKTVQMPAQEFEAEHKELPRILVSGTPEERMDEAKRQVAEARHERVRRKLAGK